MERTTSWLLFALLVVIAAVRADEVVLRSGIRVKGKVRKQTEQSVIIEIDRGYGPEELTFEMAKVRSITVGDKKTVVAKSGPEAVRKAPALTSAELEAILEKAGAAPPAWLDTAPPFPEKLDLTWGTANGDPETDLAAWLGELGAERAAQRSAVKALHASVAATAGEPEARKRSMIALADRYFLLGDWARAACWWKRAAVLGSDDCPYGLILCYARLTARKEARSLIPDVDKDPTKDFLLIRACIEARSNRKAIRLIETEVGKPKTPDNYMRTAERFRKAGIWQAAEYCYAKRLLYRSGEGNWPGHANPGRARLALLAIFRNEARTDMERVPDGTHRGSCPGFEGPVDVAVTVKGHRITAVRVLRHRESRPRNAFSAIPPRIVGQQGIIKVDAVTGAMVTSNTIMVAAAQALKMAERPPAPGAGEE